LEQRLAELGEQADILVIDSPPTLAVSDPVVLAQAVDAVLLVADAQATRGSHLDQARAAIEQAGGRVLGVSLNKIRERRDGYYGYKPYGRPRPAPEADALDDAPRAEEPRGADAAPVARATRRTALIVGAALGGVAAVGLFAALASQVVGFGPDAAPPPDATAPPAASVSTSSNEVETPAPILGALTEAGVPDSLPPATSGAGAPETLQPSPASANEPRTVLDERFTDNQRSWPSNAEGTAWHADGAYRLFARDRARFVAIGAPVGESLRDVVVTATLRKVGGPPGGRYGIIVRDQGPSPRDGNNQVGQFYVFVVNDRGELGIWRREGDRWIDLVASNPSPAVQRDAATNVLTVQAVGRRLTFVVNGIEVADVTDAVLAEGGVGVYASGDLNDVVVERFVVQEPPSPRADASASEAEPPAREPQMARATIQVPGGFTTVLLREGPSTSARSLSALPNGMPVDIAEETAEGDGFRWVRARTSDGLVGWIVSTAVAL